jgi:membrane protease YdiL (CAAX protease family)
MIFHQSSAVISGKVTTMKRVAVTILQLVGYLILVLLITIALMGLAKMFIGDWETGDPRTELLGEGLLTILGIVLTNLIIFWSTQSKQVFRGWPRFSLSLKWFGRGTLIGIGMSVMMLLLTLAFGGARLVFEKDSLQAYFTYVIPLGGSLLAAALSEEWLFRGYPMIKLADVIGRGWANVLLALLFAVAHLNSSGSSWMSATNIVLGSLVVGALRFTAGGIPAAWGFHFAWNYVQVLGGASLSLENINIPGITFTATGPTLFSGGTFGPEAGIGATIATILVLVFLFSCFRRHGINDLPIPLGRSRTTTTQE